MGIMAITKYEDMAGEKPIIQATCLVSEFCAAASNEPVFQIDTETNVEHGQVSQQTQDDLDEFSLDGTTFHDKVMNLVKSDPVKASYFLIDYAERAQKNEADMIQLVTQKAISELNAPGELDARYAEAVQLLSQAFGLELDDHKPKPGGPSPFGSLAA